MEDNVEESSHQMQGKRVDYAHLNDPWQDDETIYTNEITNLLEGDNDQLTLEQAKWSLELPEWEYAIQAKLAQLWQKGTW